jgi:hypothetical protein
MVINFTKIYLQNKQSSLILTDVGNPGPAIGQAQKYGGVKPVNGIPILSFIYVCTSVKQKYIRT